MFVVDFEFVLAHREKLVTENGIINPLPTNVPHHIETSQLICNANQLTGFYMMGSIGR